MPPLASRDWIGIDHDLYHKRISAAAKSAEVRKAALEAKCKALLK